MKKILRNLSVLAALISLGVGYGYECFTEKIGGEATTIFLSVGKYCLVNGYEYIEVSKSEWYSAYAFKVIRLVFFLIAFIGALYLMFYMLFLREDDLE